MKVLLSSVLIVAAFVLPAHAEQSLEQAAQDPTASLMNVQVANWYTSDFHNVDDKDANAIVVRSAVPFQWGEHSHIMRVTIPVLTAGPFTGEGLSDITVFDLVTFDRSWGRLGAGVVGLVPTGGEDRGAEKWGLGPAIGFVAQEKGLLWGLFNQNIFTVAGEGDRQDVNVSIIQPITSLSLGDGWSLGFSEMTVTYDWEEEDWISLPLGLKMTKLKKFGKLPVQFSAEYEYDFADDQITSTEQVFRITAKFLFPTGG